MVYLYMPSGQPLSRELGLFLESLLSEIVLAIDTLRMRNQETTTLRQLQLARSSEKDLEDELKEFLENAQQALEADYAMLWLRSVNQTQALVIFGRDASDRLDALHVDSIIQQAIQCNELVAMRAGEEGAILPVGVGSILAVPLAPPDSAPLGAMLIANHSAEAFFPRQKKVLKTLASQAAVLVENQRYILDLEYHTVMDERNRLAREIHDGLAQTLAFLKLQASQMQSYLDRGETSRLREALNTNYKTLTDAYLDTRQAIDHLRVTPKESMRTWLTQTAGDFMEATRINASLSITIDPVGLPLEIQAQLLRVVQEALSNIRKHARAQHVTLSLFRWQADLILEVSDDGQGFSPDDIPTISQYGLRGMRERADLIGADFQIISSPDHGTTVRLRLPYRLEEAPV
jgi:two-component system nitrate/nitrite sensor histidine kinase NarX